MKKLLLLFFLSSQYLWCIAQTPKVVSGSIQHFENFPSKFIQARNIDVWLPENYSAKNKYPVLYMHDGQMLFDTSINWNHQSWNVDKTIDTLLKQNKIKACIVVGIWNIGSIRHSDYFPQKPFQGISKTISDSIYKANRTNGNKVFNEAIHSDKYLQFIVEELKPFIDSNYATKKDRANTFIAGSSMGGLISMYAICEFPTIFGGAACLSTHWPGIFTLLNNPIPDAFLNYLNNNLPSPKNHKLYFDHGTATLDSMYGNIQLKADSIINAKGYTKKNFMTKVFVGEEHSEKAWAKRFSIPLQFLLNK
jgi:predicted alpha/beta superfamily hydrolase